MQPATAGTVVGDFDNAPFDYHEIRSTFSRSDDGFLVETDGAEGEMAEFVISETFGVDPLQQYLITFPDGRKQALGIAWDTRPATQGGERWFHLYPEEVITAGDELHWTGRNQNWNYMCADCHSTDIRKNYDPGTGTYETGWEEITVGCEACHGPGSAHTADPEAVLPLGTLPADRSSASRRELNACAKCHSRRGMLAEGFTAADEFLDHYQLALLDEGLYHADGQILEEVYVYGSFLQSKMYQRGVRCTDCHDPHSASLKAPGNATCTRCHQAEPPSDFPGLRAKVYDSPEHHFHGPGTAGGECVSCHMPSKLYMVIDERHDHGFRIPRPDLTASIGVPNACNACHQDRGPEWAAEAIQDYYGHEPAEHYGGAIAAARRGAPEAESALAEIAGDTTVPGIVRATSLSLLGGYDRAMSEDAIVAGLRDTDALVRIGALRGARRLNPQRSWRVASSLLDDPLLAVRAEATAILAPAARLDLSERDRQRLSRAIDEYVTTQMLSADRPEAMTNIGIVKAATGNLREAEAAYRDALMLDPAWLPAMINLADLYRELRREDEGRELLRSAVGMAPDNAEVQFAYGLLLARQAQTADAVAHLQRARELAPENARYAYVYGVALNTTEGPEAAVEALAQAHERFPQDADILFALSTIERDRGNIEAAIGYAETLRELRPFDQAVRKLIDELRSMDAGG